MELVHTLIFYKQLCVQVLALTQSSAANDNNFQNLFDEDTKFQACFVYNDVAYKKNSVIN